MSSLVGHAVTGAAIAFARADTPGQRMGHALPWLVLLAICADFDYLLFWSFGIDLRPRFTHSLAFALVAATAAWTLGRLIEADRRPPESFAVLCLAACSHPALDLLVGVHALPLFWPFVASEVASPIGVLPSAAHVSLTNHFLWRNLLIEAGVLLPALALGVSAARTGSPMAALKRCGILVLPWIGFLAWSISLHR